HPKFTLTRTDRIATAGSCFAQHISRRLGALGFNYFVPEGGEGLTPEDRQRGQYGVFSARYGNLYTVHQLNQLFREAMHGEGRHETAWQREDGRFVDPYRPTVAPEGYASPGDVAEARAEHLGHVRRVFAEADIFVFTLGLTEAWRSREDGAVFPLAPGVAGGGFDEARHTFHNFTIDETRAELASFLDGLREVNPEVRVLLTVSPVPLIATFEDRHVLVSTTYSKSVLRVAAQAACDASDMVDYFPSYEIITGSPTGGMYFEEDSREVNSIGVAHAMRSFVSAYTDEGDGRADMALRREESEAYGEAASIVCDEEEVDRSVSS
ncbi:GSCFA family protein, partial [Roseovarius sp. HI0049]